MTVSTTQNLPVHRLGSNAPDYLAFEVSRFSGLPLETQSPFPHRHAFYSIILIEAGRGSHVIDFEPHPVIPDSLYFLSPGQVHFWQTTRWLEGRLIFFDEAFLLISAADQSLFYELDFFHGVQRKPHFTPSPDQLAEIRDIVSQIEREFNAQAFGRTSSLRAYLRILLIRLQRFIAASVTPRPAAPDASLVHRFKKLVSENFATEKSPTAYAAMLAVSPAHLGDTVKTLTGLTPGQIVRTEIILEAKRLLAHTNQSVAEIAYALNFDDPSYFGRFFRRDAGMSPGAFRRQIHKKYQNFR